MIKNMQDISLLVRRDALHDHSKTQTQVPETLTIVTYDTIFAVNAATAKVSKVNTTHVSRMSTAEHRNYVSH